MYYFYIMENKGFIICIKHSLGESYMTSQQGISNSIKLAKIYSSLESAEYEKKRIPELYEGDFYKKENLFIKPVELIDNLISWKDHLNIESIEGYWEITLEMPSENNNINTNEKILSTGNVILHYVPEDNYSNKDIKIIMPYKHFEDLIHLIKRLH